MKNMIVDHGIPDQIAWKSTTEDFEFGSRLVVHESQQAVFYRDGQAIEVLGPGMHTLETGNLPFLRHLTKLRFGRFFHAEVYFVNHAVQMAMPWGTRERVNVMIEVEPGKALPLSVGASGSMNLQADPEQVLKLLSYLLGTGVALTRSDLNAHFGGMMNMFIKTYLANAIQQYNLNVFTLDRHMQEISSLLHSLLKPEFEKYGIILREFYLTAFALPEDDHAFQQAKLLYEQRYAQHGKLDLEMDLEIKKAEHEAKLAGIRQRKTLIEADTQAMATETTARGEAARRSLEGISSIQEHQFDTLNRMVESGGGTGGSPVGGGAGEMTGFFGDMMKMGVGMQMMKDMGGIMKDTMSASAQTGAAMAGAAAMNGQGNTWRCECGKTNGMDSAFCGGCGRKKAAAQPSGWTCGCGRVNDADSNFCGACGKKKVSEWTCGCGRVNAADSAFCGGCGKAKGGS